MSASTVKAPEAGGQDKGKTDLSRQQQAATTREHSHPGVSISPGVFQFTSSSEVFSPISTHFLKTSLWFSTPPTF